MPTILALDVSLSMTRTVPNQVLPDNLTYHHLAVHGINQFLDHLTNSSKLEFVSLEVEQLRQEKLEIDQQLRAIQESTMGSMQNFPMSRRLDRGYSSDLDSIRSIRGGVRGRGRVRGAAGAAGSNSRYHQGSRKDGPEDDLNSRGDHPRAYAERNNGAYRGINDRRGGRRTGKSEFHSRDNHNQEEINENREVSSVERAESYSSTEGGTSRRRRRQKFPTQNANGSLTTTIKQKALNLDVKQSIDNKIVAGQNNKELGNNSVSARNDNLHQPKGRRPKNKNQENFHNEPKKEAMINGTS